MNKQGPVIIIDDDEDDILILMDYLKEMQVQNQILTFDNGISAYLYLRSAPSPPSVIFCDIVMPELNGIQLKANLDNDSGNKHAIAPLVFYSALPVSEINNKFKLKLNNLNYINKNSQFSSFKQTLNSMIKNYLPDTSS